MKPAIVALGMLLASSVLATAALPGAALGSAFADAYASFAPLYEFYRTYAEHLFSGGSVEVPTGLAVACSDYGEALQALQLAVITQTASSTSEALGYLVRIRSDVESLCMRFGDSLTAISADAHPDEATLDGLGVGGLFSSIYDLNRLFESTLSAVLAGAASDRARWNISVTFVVRGLLRARTFVSISAGITRILYGHLASTAPPFVVPNEVVEAMATLVALAGEALTVAQRDVAADAARTVYSYFMGDAG